MKKKLSPGRIIVLGFAMVILIGALLLLLPISNRSGVKVSFIDALFTSTSAVCVTGLATVDLGDSFNVLGRSIIAILIQIGGLGVATFGASIVLLSHKRIGLKERVVLKEGLNLDSINGVVRLVRSVLLYTLLFEAIGVLLNFIVFVKDYKPLSALGISIFHSISAFNNAGFDILGGFRGLTVYRGNVLLTLTTSFLIIFGGLGFIVIREIKAKKSLSKLSMHAKIVLSMTMGLLLIGTVLLKLTENCSWLDAFFHSVSARTAGFSTISLGSFTAPGLLIMIVLMFIGASPGSTGGGIKTTTAFTILNSIFSMSQNKVPSAFKRRISMESITKAYTIAGLGILIIIVNTLLCLVLEPAYSFTQILFEVVSAFGTVGLSTGITPAFGSLTKLILCITMFIGRLGPLTMATIWSYKAAVRATYGEEKIIIG